MLNTKGQLLRKRNADGLHPLNFKMSNSQPGLQDGLLIFSCIKNKGFKADLGLPFLDEVAHLATLQRSEIN
ncbi:hypothetical protein HNY73_013504 [Argiope bruennichi]|uniref:Uncharacterized protein n=1 Tax=Argiope bruennichi TaxID=94029 RepID=A0A8T0F306_ARGBR|nr:hypothetical protein HNY73_013504 [Argiope bruennichi]